MNRWLSRISGGQSDHSDTDGGSLDRRSADRTPSRGDGSGGGDSEGEDQADSGLLQSQAADGSSTDVSTPPRSEIEEMLSRW